MKKAFLSSIPKQNESEANLNLKLSIELVDLYLGTRRPIFEMLCMQNTITPT